MTDYNPARWKKSIRSGNNSNCVEIAETQDVVNVRDSKNSTTALTSTENAGWKQLRQRIQ